MRLILIGIIYLLGTAMALQSVVYASCLFVWTDIFRPLAFARNPYAFPAAWYVFFLLIGAYALNLARGKFKPILGGYFRNLCILIAWIGVTVIMSPFRADALTEYIRYLKYLLPLLLIYSSLRSLREIRILSAALAASVGIWACETGVMCLLKGPIIDMGIPDGQMGERNDFTAAIVATIPIIIYFLFSYRGRFQLAIRGGCGIAVLLGIVSIVMSLSRGASLGLGISMLTYVALVSRKKIRDSLIIVVAVGIIAVLLPKAWFDRMQTIELSKDQKEGSAMQRMEAMTGAFHATLDRPVFGWGPDGWLHVVTEYTSMTANPHSIYLKLSSETGVVGLALFLWIMGYSLMRLNRAVWRAKQHGDKDGARMAMAFMTSLLGYLAALTFLNAPFHEYLWSWLSIANAFTVIYPREMKTRAMAGAAPLPPGSRMAARKPRGWIRPRGVQGSGGP